MAADLVGRKVNLILAGGSVVGVQAAMAATQSIPILFTTAVNPALRETSGRDGAFYFVCGASANNNNLLPERTSRALNALAG